MTTVLRTLRSAHDVSAGSAELAAAAESWELAEHFSPARLGLLAPLRLREGLAAVDLGCGSGVLTRALGEAGLRVVGVEAGDLAAAARERCRDLPNVRVVEDPPNDPVDLALVSGVPLPGSVAETLNETGVLVLAVENRLGLRHLLGGTGEGGPHTWSRGTLSALLADAGLPAQRWLLPYPDHKLPRVILDESIFSRPDAAELVDKLVRDPLQGAFGGNDAAASGRVLHELAVREGFGAAVAPAFLILAAKSDAALRDIADPGLAWLTAGARRPHWRRTRRLDDSLVLRTVRKGTPAAHPWLRQLVVDEEPLLPGRGLDAHLLDALRDNDLDRLRDLLARWRAICTAGAATLTGEHLRHPYLPGRPEVAVLPAGQLDAHPGNLIVGPDGSITQVDREWVAGDGVDAELVLLRGLLELAKEIVGGQAAHPWPDALSVRQLFDQLCAEAELTGPLARRWPELIAAEAEFQEAVFGQPAAELAAAIEAQAEATQPEPLWQIPGGLRTLRADRSAVGELSARQRELERQLDELRAHNAELSQRLAKTEHELSTAHWELHTKDDRLGLAFAELASAARDAETAWQTAHRARAEADEATGRLTRTRARLDNLERSRLIRLAHRLVWPAGRAVRGGRDVLLGRGGEEADAILRAVDRRLPAVSPLVGIRLRRSPRREPGLYYDLAVPSEPVPVGSGQVVELHGWLVHTQVPVRAATLIAGAASIAFRIGYHRPDVRDALLRSGIHAPDGCGVHARIPVEPVTGGTELPLRMIVELADGTRLERELPALTLRPGTGAEPVAVPWPADGPRVAICLASHNPDQRLLADQLDSLRAQKHANWVCLISDDGSSPDRVDGIRGLIADDPRFFLVEHTENAGFYRNFERALALTPTDADFVALCDQDDIWDADKLDTLIECLADPAISLAYADMRLIGADGEQLAESFWRHRRNQWHDLDSLLLLNTVTGAASMIRAELVRDRILPFPPGTPSAFHDQWMAAVALTAGRLAFVDRPLQSYRQHADAVTGRRDNRLDEGLPRGLGWLRLGLRGRANLAPDKEAELESVAEFELRRVAQFATVLAMRASLASDVRALAGVEDGVWPLATRAVRAGRAGRPETAGAERFLLAAALRWKGLRRKRLRMPQRVVPPLD